VVDADLSRYFDSIPHDELLKSVARRIVDRRVLRLIKLWLKAPIEEWDISTLRISTRRICSFSFSIFSFSRLVLVLSASDGSCRTRTV
jgi:hypothetical protein